MTLQEEIDNMVREDMEPLTEESSKLEILKRAIYYAVNHDNAEINGTDTVEGCIEYIKSNSLRRLIAGTFNWSSTIEHASGFKLWSTLHRQLNLKER